MTPASKVDVVARLLAVIGVLLALASLTWQVFSWRLSGPRVKVRARLAVTGTGADDTFAAVEARNTGRAAVTVTGWGFLMPDKGQFVWPRSPIGSAPVPYRLEPHADATWYAPWHDVVTLAKGRRTEVGKLAPFVRLGNGKTVTGKRSLS